eukprot:Colp12_sorted_trinity150504_noHs@7508
MMSEEIASPDAVYAAADSESVQVDIPEASKRDPNDSFVTYEVKSSVMDKGSRVEHTVYRRYSEFDKLFNLLSTLADVAIVPPLPGKTGIGGLVKIVDQFAPEFIEKRRRSLLAFLRRVAAHPTLSKDAIFLAFLSVQDNWEKMGVERTDKHRSASSKLREPNVDFVNFKNSAGILQENLGNLLKLTEKLNKKQADLYQEMSNYGGIFHDWSAIEKELGDVLQATGHFMDSLSLSIQTKNEQEEEGFLDPLHQYVLYTDSMKGLVKRYEQKLGEVEHAEDCVTQRRKELEALKAGEGGGFTSFFKKDTPEAREAKIQAATRAFEEAERELGEAKREHAEVEAKGLEEIKRFAAVKEKDLRRIVSQYAQLQVAFYKKNLTAWQNLQKVFEQV